MTQKKVIWILGIAVVIGCVIFYVYNNVLYKEARNIKTEQSSFVLSSLHLMQDYTKNTAASDLKYLNKTIEIKGTVTEQSKGTIILDSILFCAFDQETEAKVLGKTVVIKGRCIGFDELFNQVKMDQCTFVQ